MMTVLLGVLAIGLIESISVITSFSVYGQGSAIPPDSKIAFIAMMDKPNKIYNITIGLLPDAVSVNPSTNMVYVANGDSVSVIDGKTNTVTANVNIYEGASPTSVAVNPSTNTVYVANEFSNGAIQQFERKGTAPQYGTVSVLDGKTNTVTANITVGIRPFGISINPSTNIAYVTSSCCNSTLSVIDGKTNKVTANIILGPGDKSLYGVSINPSTNMVYVANTNDNTLSVIDGNTNKVTANIKVGKGPTGVSVNPTTNMVYVANSADNTTSAIDGKSNKVTATIAVGTSPNAVSVNPSNNMVYVANANITPKTQPSSHHINGTVSVIDGKTNKVIDTIGVGTLPRAVAVNPSTNIVYVTNGLNTLSVINGKSNSN